MLSGEYKSFYEKGTIESKCNYVDGRQEGPKYYYYENGALKREENYVDGELNDMVRDYFPNGRIKKEEFYKSGVLQTSKIYDEGGKLVSSIGS
ncbi:MAG TPA: hypothetical protein VI230_06915 [Ignavibacteriaceae bacterium]